MNNSHTNKWACFRDYQVTPTILDTPTSCIIHVMVCGWHITWCRRFTTQGDILGEGHLTSYEFG